MTAITFPSADRAKTIMAQVNRELQDLGDLLGASKNRQEAEAIYLHIVANAYLNAEELWDDANTGNEWSDDEQDKEGQNEAPAEDQS